MIGIVWHFIVSWAGIDVAVGIIATLIAIFEPAIIAAVIPDLRKWAVTVAVVAFTLTGAIAYGYRNGIEVTRTQWGAALVKEAASGEKARADAVRAVGTDTADRRVFDHDRFNRNAGK